MTPVEFPVCIEPQGHKPGEWCMPIFERLNAIVQSHINARRKGEPEPAWHVDRSRILPLSVRLRLCREVDALHRAGYRWAWMRWGVDDRLSPWSPKIYPEEERKPTPRPDHLPYCLTWYRAFWMPCKTVKERRESGYLQLPMTWPAPLPKPRSYLVNRSGRGRFAYLIAEVERYAKPRGTNRYTCRLWVTRHPLTVVKSSDVVHTFYWHARGKRRK